MYLWPSLPFASPVVAAVLSTHNLPTTFARRANAETQSKGFYAADTNTITSSPNLRFDALPAAPTSQPVLVQRSPTSVRALFDFASHPKMHPGGELETIVKYLRLTISFLWTLFRFLVHFFLCKLPRCFAAPVARARVSKGTVPTG